MKFPCRSGSAAARGRDSSNGVSRNGSPVIFLTRPKVGYPSPKSEPATGLDNGCSPVPCSPMRIEPALGPPTSGETSAPPGLFASARGPAIAATRIRDPLLLDEWHSVKQWTSVESCGRVLTANVIRASGLGCRPPNLVAGSAPSHNHENTADSGRTALNLSSNIGGDILQVSHVRH